MRRIGQEMSDFVAANPFAGATLFGVLPAVCEELFFRGFVLSGFASSLRGRGAAVRAVVLTSALFAVFHIFPEKWLPTFLMGLVLGLLAARTGSIWPGILAHVINNVSAVLEVFRPLRDPKSQILEPWAVAAAALLLAVGVVTLLAPRRPRGNLTV